MREAKLEMQNGQTKEEYEKEEEEEEEEEERRRRGEEEEEECVVEPPPYSSLSLHTPSPSAGREAEWVGGFPCIEERCQKKYRKKYRCFVLLS